jgi:hypothetical protein
MQTIQAGANPGRPSNLPPIEYFSVHLSPLADGRVFVGVDATVCEAIDGEDFELISMEVARRHVGTYEDALAVIREAVSAH